MDPQEELKEAIKENKLLIEENYQLIKKIHRSVVLSRIVRVIYWVVIIGATLGAYYFIQPYIDGVIGAYDNVRTGFEAVQDVGDSIGKFGNVDSILDNFVNPRE